MAWCYISTYLSGIKRDAATITNLCTELQSLMRNGVCTLIWARDRNGGFRRETKAQNSTRSTRKHVLYAVGLRGPDSLGIISQKLDNWSACLLAQLHLVNQAILEKAPEKRGQGILPYNNAEPSAAKTVKSAFRSSEVKVFVAYSIFSGFCTNRFSPFPFTGKGN